MKTSRRTSLTRRATAYHESGHAVAALSLRLGVKKVTIVPDEGILGLCEHYPSPAWLEAMQTGAEGGVHRSGAERRIMVMLAGGIAERIFRGNPIAQAGDHHDVQQAFDLAFRLSGSTEEANRYVAWLHERTKNLLTQPDTWAAVKAVAELLLERRTVSNREVRQIHSQLCG